MARVFVDSEQVSIEMKKFVIRLCAGILTFTIGVAVAALCHVNRHQLPPEIVLTFVLQVPKSRVVRPPIPADWNKVTADGLFSFYVPKNMKVSGYQMSEESAWGRSFSNKGMRLYAEYSSWDERYAADYLAKQFEHEREGIELNGRKAVVQSWRWAEPATRYKYEAEVRVYDARDRMLVRMSADCMDRADVELAKQIFKTVEFP
jgi:hypothetical protein